VLPKDVLEVNLSGSGYNDAVLRNNLWLEGEDFAAPGIHQDLNPVNVISVVRIGVG